MARKHVFNWKQKKEEILKEEEEKKQQFGDKRFWTFTVDPKTKKGSAIIRFLPDMSGTPYKQYFSHWFKFEGPRGEEVYAGKCATTINQGCAVCEKNREYWKSPFDRDKKIARDRKRKMHYISNIYVIKDPARPETEGKVWLFDYGAQIYKPFKEAMFGPDDAEPEDLEELNLYMPCDFEEGADYNLRSALRKGTDWVTYEPSKFKSQSKFFGNLKDDERDVKLDELIEMTYDLSEFLDPKTFPSDTEVRTKLASILGGVVLEDEDVEKDPVYRVEGVEPEQPDPDEQMENPTSEPEPSGQDMSDEAFFAELSQ